MTLRFVAPLLLAGVLSAMPACATTLKVTLIQAQNEGINDDVPQDARIRKCLNKLFGYSRYAYLGDASGTIEGDKETYIRPTPTFHLKIVRDAKSSETYHFEFFQEHKSLLQGSFIPKPDVPLIIRGPYYDKGLLVLVVNKVAD